MNGKIGTWNYIFSINHRLSCAILFFASLLAVATSYVVPAAGETGASLSVTVSQTGADVYLDGKLLGQSPLEAITGLEPGSHELEIKAKGFRTYKRKITLVQGENTQVSVFLQAKVGGKLYVSSITKDATVFIDDFEIGRVPLKGPIHLEPGKHEVKVTKLGFTAFSKSVDMKKGRTVKVQADLLAFAGILDVRASVTGATVLLDGEVIGEAPLEKEVFAGEHSVEVKKDGFSTYRETLKVAAGKSYSVMARLEPLAGTIGTKEGDLPATAETSEAEGTVVPPAATPEPGRTYGVGEKGVVGVSTPVPQPGKETTKEGGGGSWYTKWWVWTAVAVVVAVAIAVPVGMEQAGSSGGGGTKLPDTDVPDIRLP